MTWKCISYRRYIAPEFVSHELQRLPVIRIAPYDLEDHDLALMVESRWSLKPKNQPMIDNRYTHKHAKVKEWLARRPSFHLHVTPITPHGSIKPFGKDHFPMFENSFRKSMPSWRHATPQPPPSSGALPRNPSLSRWNDFVHLSPGHDTSWPTGSSDNDLYGYWGVQLPAQAFRRPLALHHDLPLQALNQSASQHSVSHLDCAQ